MRHYFKAIIILITVGIFLIILKPSTGMALTISAGGSGTYTYAWDLVGDGPTTKFSPDSTYTNLAWGYEYHPPEIADRMKSAWRQFPQSRRWSGRTPPVWHPPAYC